jgi:hypothetical protein
MTNKDCDVTFLLMIATRNTRDLMRDWCAATGYPLPNLIGRGRAVREAGLLTQGALGINAPPATVRDGAVLLLAIAASRTWKDAPAEVERYGSLPLYKTTGHNPITRTDFDPDWESGQMNDVALNAMADLLVPNVAAANRARAQAEHETGPSASTDEPIPLDDQDDLTQAETPETNPSDDLPRAARPATTTADLEASDKETKSQVGFKSCGGSSGGSPLPPTEFCDDHDRPDRPSPCAA